ncbi:MAG: translation initiation factor [Anaerolineae bacterium]
MTRKKPKLVYSTRPDAELPGDGPSTHRMRSAPPRQQTIRVRLDKKRRRGKTVTVAAGFALTPADLKSLGKTLRQLCGAGGTVKGDEVEIQGDHRRAVMQRLAALGYNVRQSGG